MPIYFIQAGENGAIKIGYTENIFRRLRNLQIACPHKLNLLAAFTGGIVDERKIHKRFHLYKLRGEWFKPVPDILVCDVDLPKINIALNDIKPLGACIRSQVLGTYLDENNISIAKFADELGVTQTALYRYMSGERMPKRNIMLLIEKKTNGQVQPNDFFRRKEVA